MPFSEPLRRPSALIALGNRTYESLFIQHPVFFPINTNNREREIPVDILGNIIFNGSLSNIVDQLRMLILLVPLGEIEFPALCVGMVAASQEATPNMLAKNAAVFVLAVKVFNTSCGQIVLSSMGSDTDDALPGVRTLACLEQTIHAILVYISWIEPGPKSWTFSHNLMQMGANFGHECVASSH
jgi:hypothetical protein